MIGGPTAEPSQGVNRVKIDGSSGDGQRGSGIKEITGRGARRRQIGRYTGGLCSVVANGVESGIRCDIGVWLG